MRDYHINVYFSEDDECYIADIPDLPGCMAHGATPQEAIDEIMVAKEGWLETARENGFTIPEPAYRPAASG